jgi:hypothetical protein
VGELGNFSPSVVTSVQPWREADLPQFWCVFLSWVGSIDEEGRVGQQEVQTFCGGAGTDLGRL